MKSTTCFSKTTKNQIRFQFILQKQKPNNLRITNFKMDGRFILTAVNAAAYGTSPLPHHASTSCIKLVAAKIASENQKISMYLAKMLKRLGVNVNQKVPGNCTYTNARMVADII